MRETQETGNGLRGRKTRVGMWQIADLFGAAAGGSIMQQSMWYPPATGKTNIWTNSSRSN